MDTAQLVLSYIQALVWPSLVFALFVVFRRQVAGLFGRLTQVEGGGLKAVFEQAQEVAQGPNALEKRTDSQARPTVAGSAKVKSPADRFRPQEFGEAREFAGAFRKGNPVQLELKGVSDELAKRLVDFAAGLVFYAGGTIMRVDDKTFLLEPREAGRSSS